MQSSRELRIRTNIISPDNPRQIKFLTPREKSKCFDFELGKINLIQSDPFNFLVKGNTGKLRPITLKTSKKCISKITESNSVCLKLPESLYVSMSESKTKCSLPSLFPDKLECFRKLQKTRPKIVDEKNEIKGKGDKWRSQEKKVKFAGEELEFSFGNS